MKVHLFLNGDYFRTFEYGGNLPKTITQQVFKGDKGFTTDFEVYSIEYSPSKNIVIGLNNDESIVIKDGELIVKEK